MNEKEFYLDKFLSQSIPNDNKKDKEDLSDEQSFDNVLAIVESYLKDEWDDSPESVKSKKLEREKNAIIGYETETNYYKSKILDILREKNLLYEAFPVWYPSIEEAVFSELYGLAGLSPWAYDMTEEYKKSSSAKLIGENLYCLIDGKSTLQPQKISKKRREQLKRALLLATPQERLEEGFHEVYLHNGIRITIFSGDRTKKNQDIMVFRKYVLNNLSFDKLIDYGTIPPKAKELFLAMIRIGYNVMFAGQVRSGKTTFLQTWQSYEDKDLEGLAIATDAETPWHEIMKDTPIMQLVADGKKLENITKSLLRGDNDYVLLEEMRDATAFNIALDITSTGTQRSKATIHDNDAINIPYKMASKISTKYGGDINAIISQVYSNFNYVLEFFQVPEDKSKKRLKGIVEYRYDPISDEVSAHRICKYDYVNDNWKWKYDIGQDKCNLAIGFTEELETFKRLLKELEEENPILEDTIIYPSYYHSKK